MTKEILRATVPAGDYWLHVVKKGQTFRIEIGAHV